MPPNEWTRRQRIAAYSGIAFVVLSLIVIPLSPVIPPALGSSPAEIAAYYAQHRMPFLIGNYLGFAAFCPGFVQLACLAALIRRAESKEGWLAGWVLSTGTFAYALGAVALLVFQAIPFLLDSESAIRAIGGLANVGFALFCLAAVPFATAVACAVFATRALPRWFGYLSAAVALLCLVASLGAITTTPTWLAGGGLASNLGLVAFFVWLLILSIVNLRLRIPIAAIAAALLVTTACSGGRRQIAEPTIWLQRSASIDPTALPLRDQAYVTSGPKKGDVFVCDAMAFQQMGGPGALKQGDWLHPAAGTYDVTRKVVVQGNVYRDDATFTVATTGDQRTINGNGLPFGVPTGVFPVASTDLAYAFDPNPNAITAQTTSFSISRNPTIAATSFCAYKRIGITLDGVQLHVPLDSQGRDELAYQLQDVCTGGSQPGGAYHRHALSECTPHIHEKSALVGYALDGFGIFSPYDKDGNELTSADLDECHGTTSEIEWEGRAVTMYHYVLTRDFPYTVSCFRGTPTRNAFPPLPGAPPET